MKYRIGCLIIHGFGGTASDVEPLSKYLQSKGFITFCPSLKCSMENRKAFSGTGYRDWINSAESGLFYLNSKCKDVVIIGFYMGSLIALNFAAKFKNYGVVAVNVPIYHRGVKNVYHNILIDFKTRDFSNVKKYIKSSAEFSLSELINFKLFTRETKHILDRVEIPIFIAQGLKDDTVNYKSAEYIYKKVSSDLKVLKYYDKLSPDLSVSPEYNLFFKDIEKFIKQIIQRENGMGNKLFPNYTYSGSDYYSLLRDAP